MCEFTLSLVALHSKQAQGSIYSQHTQAHAHTHKWSHSLATQLNKWLKSVNIQSNYFLSNNLLPSWGESLPHISVSSLSSCISILARAPQ